MTKRPTSQPVPKTAKVLVIGTFEGSGTANRVPADKSAGQRLCPASPSLKGVCGCLSDPHPHPFEGGPTPGTHKMTLVPNLPELWLGAQPLEANEDEAS